MFYFAPQIIRHNKITMDTKDILSFYPSPAVSPQRRFGIVFAYFIFRNNDITIRSNKLNNNGIPDTSPEYSESTFGGICADGFKNSKHSRLMLEGQSQDEKLVQPTANEAKVKINERAA
jgi:hypothetical protein